MEIAASQERVLIMPREARKRYGQALYSAVLASMNLDEDWPEDSEMVVQWFTDMRRAVDVYNGWQERQK